MWNELSKNKKMEYKRLITNFASLSEAFSQKKSENNNLVPIVNSKFQEKVFQLCFDAIGEDINNTSFDVSINLGNTKYLVGIKSFNFKSKIQKVAQFKSLSTRENWNKILIEIDSDKQEEKLEKYRDLAIKISEARNLRIKSSFEQIKGFKIDKEDYVKSIYHVLMTVNIDGKPYIFVGEKDYSLINVDNIEVIESKSHNVKSNFKFYDGNNTYKYTSSDSQLYMNFDNENIVLDKWPITYISDPIEVFKNLNIENISLDSDLFIDSVSWYIPNKNGIIEESSGFNAFDGAPKLPRKNNYREKLIERLEVELFQKYHKDIVIRIKIDLENLLLKEYKNKKEKLLRKKLRNEFFDFIEKNLEIIDQTKIKKLLLRPVKEMYIPIPNSKDFHKDRPNFFGNDVGLFNEKTGKLVKSKNERSFNLEFLSSGDVIKAYINQDYGKGIQSINQQGILGEWILKGVFQLKERELLTTEKLFEIGINGIRLYKYKEVERGIALEFIWIDSDKLPEDFHGDIMI